MSPDVAAPRPPEEQDSGFDVRGIVRRVALFAVVAIAALVALATLPGVDEVRDRLAAAEPHWLLLTAACSLASMLGFAAALSGSFEQVMPARAAIRLGFAEQGANVLLPAGGGSGPALGTIVMRRAGVPPELAVERHVALFLVTSAVSFAALVLAGVLVGLGLLPSEDVGPVGAWVPAGAGAAVIGVALLFARTAPPPEPAGGRVRHAIWRVHGFLHGGVRTSVVLLRHGSRC